MQTSVLIKTRNGEINVFSPWTLKDVCKSIPGALWDREQKCWKYFRLPETARAIRDAFAGRVVETDDEFDRLIEQGIKEAEPVAAAIDGARLEYPQSYATAPWKHQVEGFHLIKSEPATLLAWEMGTGKSKAIVDVVCNLKPERTLIVAPKSVVEVWPNEFWKHGSCDVWVGALTEDSIAQRCARLFHHRRMGDIRKIPCVIVINYDAVWRAHMAEALIESQFDMIVCDESHRIKSSKAKATRFLAELGLICPKRVCLTGTPLAHSPMDAFGQYLFLDRTIYGRSYTRFRAQYAIMGGYKEKQVIGFRNMDDFNARFYRIAHRVRKQDVLDLPEQLHETRSLALSKEALRIYRELERHAVAEIDDGVMTAANAVAKLLRLQQVTSGIGVTDNDHKIIDTSKRAALIELLEDLPDSEPVVCFARFRLDLQQIQAAARELGRGYFELSGRVNELAAWQRSTKGDLLGVQIQSGGVGIDLTRACYCVYYSIGFSLGDYEQSLARLHRPGQRRAVTYLHLVARDTVDEYVYSALSRRKEIVEHVLTKLKSKGEPDDNGD